MKTPGPDHPVEIARAPRRMRARFENHVIADSAEALVLREAEAPPVVYFPRDDVERWTRPRSPSDARGTPCDPGPRRARPWPRSAKPPNLWTRTRS